MYSISKQPEPPPIPERILISASTYRSLRVEQVIYAPSLPEYPDTSIKGIAYIVKVEGMPKEEIDGQLDMVI